MVLYDYDTNAILVRPIKTRNASELKNNTIELLTILQERGHPPQLHILDNEASAQLKHALLKNKIEYQLVPPHLHRRNMAERAIQTFKAHFKELFVQRQKQKPEVFSTTSNLQFPSLES